MARATITTTKQQTSDLDFSAYSLPKLLKVKKEIETEIQSRQAKEFEELRAKVAATAQTFGVSIEEIMGLSRPGKRLTRHPRGKQPARYRGPNGEEWSGRGPSPRWMKPLLAAGKTKDDFLIR